MKIRFFVISLLVFLPVIVVSGQVRCTETDLARKPGILRASRLSGSTGGLAAADVTRARASLTKIHQSIAASYTPMGVVGDYSFHFGGGTTAGTFGYSIYMLKYRCDPGDPTKSYVSSDTPTVVRLDANVINPLNLSAADTSDNTSRGYLFMRNLPKKVDGFYYLGDNPEGSPRQNQKEYTWLVTYDDRLPFAILTRKEFLQLTKARLEKSIVENGNSSGFYDQYVNRVNEYLRMSDADLAQPAIINRIEEERFTDFLREGERGAFYAIRHNPAYYRPGLPKSAAQFFTVIYSVYEGDAVPVYPDNIAGVKKALDLNLLRGMLGRSAAQTARTSAPTTSTALSLTAANSPTVTPTKAK